MNNITFALRVLLKDKFYSLLNILGLAVGLAVAIIIFMYVKSDLSFDKQHKKHGQIYRLESKFDDLGRFKTTPLQPLGKVVNPPTMTTTVANVSDQYLVLCVVSMKQQQMEITDYPTVQVPGTMVCIRSKTRLPKFVTLLSSATTVSHLSRTLSLESFFR